MMNRRTFIMGGIGAVGMLAAGGWSFTRRPEFGRLPQGERLARLQASPHYNEYKMSPTSISGGGKLLTGGELISPASLKGQEEVLPTAKLEQWPYKNGQYNMAWHTIHMLPEETAQAASDVGAKMLLPAHGGKFALSRHPWQEPYRELARFSQGRGYKLLTTEIGEAAYLDNGSAQTFPAWWEKME